MNPLQRSAGTMAALLALGGTAWVGAARSQTAASPTLSDYYGTQQPPALETLVPPGAEPGSNGMAGGVSNLRLLTYTSALSFKQVCRFYTNRLLPPDSEPQALGVQGDLKKQSGCVVDERSGSHAATFCQRTSGYSVTAFVHRSAQDTRTQITLVCGQN